MDDMAPWILVLGVVGFILVAPIVALVRASRAKTRIAAIEAELQAGLKVLREMTGRIYALEQARKSETAQTTSATVAPAATHTPR